jgi:hypothetical protein
MPKPIPNKLDAAVKKAQADFMVESFDRMKYAKAVYDHQNLAAQDAIDRMQSLLIRQARKYMWVGAGKGDRIVVEIPNDAIWNNALYMAVEILKDLAYMDIRVADFTWPTDLCMECGTEIKPIRKKARA